MSNKFGGFLILFAIILLSSLFYWYFFIFSLLEINIESNVDNYELTFTSSGKGFTQTCEQSNCFIKDVSPFEYDITGIKDGYKNLEIRWKPSKNNTILNLEFKKDYQLEKIDTISQKEAVSILEGKLDKDENIDIQNKIEELKIQQNLHLEVQGEKTKYSFINQGEKLLLLEGTKQLGVFDYFPISEISLTEILGNNYHIFLTLGENKYIFSKNSGNLQEIILEIPIEYIKSTGKNGEFIFVTEKGSFVYNLYNNTFKYNSFFSDFVFFEDDAYVGIIYSDEKEKKLRFGTQSIPNNSLIIYYHPETKETRILLDTDKKIQKIFKEAGEIYFTDNNNNNFLLTQLKE